MNQAPSPHPHEPAFHRPGRLWPLWPWLRWGWHGLFIPGHSAYQFFRFCLIGSLGVGVNVAVYYAAFHHMDFNYVWASALAFLVASVNNFSLNKYFTFHDKNYQIGSVLWQYAKFLSFALIGWGINVGILVALVELFDMYPLLANVIGVLVATVTNFLGNKFIAFKQPT